MCRQRWPECEGLMGWPMCDNKVWGPGVWAIYPFYPIVSNGSVYAMCGSWMIHFHNIPAYLPAWPLSYWKNQWTEHIVCTMLETVGTKWVVLARPSAAGQPLLCAGYCVDRVGRLLWFPINCTVWMFIFVFDLNLNKVGRPGVKAAVARVRKGPMRLPKCDNKVCGNEGGPFTHLSNCF